MGCFWTWQNGVFWVCFFWSFNVIVVCFWCVWHSSRSVKNACFFSQFFGLLWDGLFLFILGLEGLGVFVFLVFVFVFLCCFCFCFVCFVFVLLLDCFLVLVLVLLLFLFLFFLLFLCSCFFCFCFCSCFCFLLFFGGFKGQVRWPKGPPHLALNPPYFFVFVFFCFLLFGFFLEGLRVRWGGPKGHLTWP